MGLIKEGEKIAILSDILGDEDHLGDMDFKVCGTEDGITAIQMDIKIGGVTRKILEDALNQAAAGRKHILGEMAKALAAPRTDISAYAPRITTIKIRHRAHQGRHRARRQGDQGHHGPHRLQHQHRGRRHRSTSPAPTRSRSTPPSR